MNKRNPSLVAWMSCIVIGVYLAACNREDGPQIQVTWTAPNAAIVPGIPVKYAGTAAGNAVAWVNIGRVVEVAPEGTGIRAEIVLRESLAHFVTLESAFIFRGDRTRTNAFIEVQTLKQGGQPVVDGTVFRATESDLGLAVKRITVNWQTTLMWSLGGAALVLLALIVMKTMIKGLAVIISLAAGVAGAVYLKPYLSPYVLPHIPADVPLDPFVYGIGFLAAYIAAVLICVLIRLPVSALSGKGH